ncbi:hypothetical protein AUR64_07955 [Haloprofundus marisrubri]|uniref:Uncharacterized protein n=1 Tax=Haloprofundus marisrubri TaxID=1514971 RepID=A0A0W1RAU9_9EURY|nr:hypothetical protein [Haloprofundus marisrubri]KTG10594.1 hypothetical protein AUR64_07955 [Haloprofundus marisrubri]
MSDTDRLKRRVRTLERHVLGAEAEDFAGVPSERTEWPLSGLVHRIRRLEETVVDDDNSPSLEQRVDELEARIDELETAASNGRTDR